jgi:hypothetical protein
MCGIGVAIGSRYVDDSNGDEKEHKLGIVSLSFDLNCV